MPSFILGATPTVYITNEPYWKTHWYVFIIILVTLALIAFHIKLIKHKKLNERLLEIYLSATFILVLLLAGLGIYLMNAVANIESSVNDISKSQGSLSSDVSELKYKGDPSESDIGDMQKSLSDVESKVEEIRQDVIDIKYDIR